MNSFWFSIRLHTTSGPEWIGPFYGSFDVFVQLRMLITQMTGRIGTPNQFTLLGSTSFIFNDGAWRVQP